MIDFKVAIKKLAPPWLLGANGTALLNTFGQMFNDIYTTLVTGVKARFPSECPDDALGYIANDRGIEQGPSEDPDNFRTRLVSAIDQNRTRGAGHTLLEQLAGYFSGIANVPIRLVSQVGGGTWHEYNYTTKATSKHIVGNWNWDGNNRWWWGFVIIDSSAGAGPWSQALICGDPSGGTFDDDATCGSTATEQEVNRIQQLVQRWKPAGVYVTRIIVILSGSFYNRTDTKPPNPNGNMSDPTNFSDNAAYWLGGGEEP